MKKLAYILLCFALFTSSCAKQETVLNMLQAPYGEISNEMGEYRLTMGLFRTESFVDFSEHFSAGGLVRKFIYYL